MSGPNNLEDVLKFVHDADIMIMMCYEHAGVSYMLPAAGRDKSLLVGTCIEFETVELMQEHCVGLAKQTTPDAFIVVDMSAKNRIRENNDEFMPCVKYEQSIGEEKGIYEGEKGLLNKGALQETIEHPVIAAMLSGKPIPAGESLEYAEAAERAAWVIENDGVDDSLYVDNKDETVN